MKRDHPMQEPGGNQRLKRVANGNAHRCPKRLVGS